MEEKKVNKVNDDTLFNAIDVDLIKHSQAIRQAEAIHGTTSYDVATKIEVIAMLEASVRYYQQKYIPNFTKVSNLTGINAVTLKEWYEKKENIFRQAKNWTEVVQNTQSLKIHKLISRIIEKLLEEDTFNSLSARQLADVLPRLILNARLLANLSTSNHAVNVNYKVNVPKPARDGDL